MGNIITYRRLKICAGKIDVKNLDEADYYNGGEMSN